jgi:hypothetical protein
VNTEPLGSSFLAHLWDEFTRRREPKDGRCSCGNSFDGDNFCMPSACQWEGIARA